MKNQRKGKKRAPRTKAVSATVSETHEDLLCRLPNELLRKIIECLDDDSHKLEKNFRKKMKQGVNLESGDKTRLWLYQHNPGCPIMSDLQSFSLVNRRIYAVCQPMIWESLQFPSLSGPMSVWNQEILPKHGCNVERLDVGLRYDWFYKPEDSSINKATRDQTGNRDLLRSSDVNKIKFIQQNKDYWQVEEIHSDNLDVYTRDTPGVTKDSLLRKSYGLGRENLLKVLSFCDNLTTLCLNCPGVWDLPPEAADKRNFGCNLNALFSQLGRLKHLNIRGHSKGPILSEYFVEPIAHLKLLETLELAHIFHNDEEQVDKLAICLSKFEHLKDLVLNNVLDIEDSWANHQGPPKLVNLTILECEGLAASDMPGLISAWAPHLTHLEIKSVEISEDEMSDYNTEHNQFQLPELTHLTMWPVSQCPFYNCFKDCGSLRHITFYLPFNYYELIDDLAGILDFLSGEPSPMLEALNLLMDYENFPIQMDVDEVLVSIEDLCKDQGIKFNYSEEDVPNELPDETIRFKP